MCFFCKKLVMCFDNMPALHIQTHLFLDQYISQVLATSCPKDEDKPPCQLNHIN